MTSQIKFQLQLQCENLKSKLTIGQPKPQCSVYIVDNQSPQPRLLGKTEVGSGLSPTFSQTIPFEYKFGTKQEILVSVKNTIWHIISRGEEKMTFGFYKIPFDVILQKGSTGVKCKLKGPASDKEKKNLGIKYTDGGRLYISAFNDNSQQGRFRLDCSAFSIPKPMIGSVESFMEITVPGERNRLLYRTEIAKGSNVNFRQMEITEGRLPDFSTDLSLEMFEYKEDGRIKFSRDNKMTYKSFGRAIFKPTDFFDGTGKGSFTLGSKGLRVELKNITEIPSTFSSYTDFVQSGMKLKFTLALDFSETSFNDHQDEEMIPYFQAIDAIGAILMNYDDDKKVPCLGYDENGIFELGEEKEELISDLPFIYRDETLKHEFLSGGEINFTPLVNTICDLASENFNCHEIPQASEYHVLIILSSGGLDDLEELIETLQNKAQILPMSVIIVGIGSNNFYVFEQYK